MNWVRARRARVGVFRQKKSEAAAANKSPRRRRLHDQTVEGGGGGARAIGVTATITRLNEADPP